MIDGYTLTNQNLVISMGGHKQPGLGSQKHLPIFVDKNGIEYVSLNGLSLQRLSDLNYQTRRENIERK